MLSRASVRFPRRPQRLVRPSSWPPRPRLSQPLCHEPFSPRYLSSEAWKGVEASLSRLGASWKEPGQKQAWQADENLEIQRVTEMAIVHELTKQQVHTIEQVVPWFLANMPASYFRQVAQSFRQDHLRAISALKDANMDLNLNLQSRLPDGRKVWTFIRPGTEPGKLLSMIQSLPYDEEGNDETGATGQTEILSRIHVFSTRDETLSLNMFVYGHEMPVPPHQVELIGADVLAYAKDVQQGRFEMEQGAAQEKHVKPGPLFERDSVLAHLAKCNETYISGCDPRRFLQHMELAASVSGTEGIDLNVEEAFLKDATNHYWVDIAAANSMPQKLLENAAHLLFLHKFDIARAHLDVIEDGENGDITLLRLLVAPIDEKPAPDECFSDLKLEMKRTKWLDPVTMDLFYRYPWLGVNRSEIITALCSLMHPVMAKVNALAYSKANILASVTTERYIPFAMSIADLFLDRFNPKGPLSDEELERRSQELREKIDNDIEDRTATDLLEKMIDIVGHTRKTNVYHPDRWALGLRLDPAVMEVDGEDREIPYGVFFVHGRRFNGYHVRFRDISRGGMRLVTPSNPEQLALESARQYDECYGLAHAQQLKNKDIPEGGSKAVNLIDVTGSRSEAWRNFVIRKSVKAFTDTLLDLIVPDQNVEMVDLVGKKEVIYLGPDEQVIPDDINWIVQRAAKRGYTTPNAFMSSKPRSGINHKDYGVTSEGVNCYLDVALRHVLGIDPTRESFTVKITGGPDGDVAGNEIKILIREYGDNVKIVGVADHSGCAEDPTGLDHEELLRLVNNNLSISNYDQARLGVDGDLHLVDTKEGVIARNTMHNRLVADAFVPAGGRPNTIDKNNYHHFLLADGTPSSPLIVEGANLFLTADARRLLYDQAGVVIVKDSSANKGGVITSSFEICSAMLLEEDEFFENKEKIVEEVLDRLKSLARMEATLLFREYDNYHGSLPDASQKVSNTINLATDALAEALDSIDDLDSLLPLFRSHLPPTISNLAFDRVKDRVPEQYIKNAIASSLASKLVYKEGSRFIEAQPREKLAQIAFDYVTKEKHVAELMESLEAADMPEDKKKEILQLLEAGGARTALNIF